MYANTANKYGKFIRGVRICLHRSHYFIRIAQTYDAPNSNKYFIAISKLVFGGSVLASIMKVEDVSRMWIFLLGMIATSLFAVFGFLMMKKNKE